MVTVLDAQGSGSVVTPLLVLAMDRAVECAAVVSCSGKQLQCSGPLRSRGDQLA